LREDLRTRHGQVYGAAVTRRLRAMGIRDKPIAAGSPWQNGFTERLIGSIRRECTDHIAALSARHLQRILQSYSLYYNEVRTHRSTPHSIGRLSASVRLIHGRFSVDFTTDTAESSLRYTQDGPSRLRRPPQAPLSIHSWSASSTGSTRITRHPPRRSTRSDTRLGVIPSSRTADRRLTSSIYNRSAFSNELCTQLHANVPNRGRGEATAVEPGTFPLTRHPGCAF
jgi:hypothetical protein